MFLAWQAWRAPDAVAARGAGVVPRGALFRDGALIGILNPKVALFQLAFFPQFVDPAQGSVLLQGAILGVSQLAVVAAYDTLVIFAASSLCRLRRRASGVGTRVAAALGRRVRGARRPTPARRAPLIRRDARRPTDARRDARRPGPWPVYLKLVGVAAIWGGTFVAGRIATAEMPAPTAALWRYVLACVVLVVAASRSSAACRACQRGSGSASRCSARPVWPPTTCASCGA